jgi:hypothetical protein
MPALTDDELRAIAYYAVGVTSEGKDVAYQLGFAGKRLHAMDGTVLLEPVGNSGYSVGELQTDLGQNHKDAAALVNAYQDWAERNHPGAEAGWVLGDARRAEQTALLQRDGHHIRDANFTADDAAYLKQHGTHMPSHLLPQSGPDIDPVFRSHLDTFLSTDAGRDFVNGLDAQQLDGPNGLMVRVAVPLKATNLYKHSNPKEQAEIFAMAAKAYNQSQIRGGVLLDEIERHQINSIADLSAKIDTFPDSMQTGRDAALAGVGVFNALQATGEANPLRETWRRTLTNPLADSGYMTDPQPSHWADGRAAVKELFVQPEQGHAVIAALERGDTYAYGDPVHEHARGFYVEGRDFLEWDRNGQGHAFIGGEWSSFSRGDVSLTHNRDHTLDVELARDGQTRRLLHITHLQRHVREAAAGTLHHGARGEAVTALQTELSKLGYIDSHGRALQADGNFGGETLHAVEAFQRRRGLAVDGEVGPRTQAAIRAATDMRKMDASVACDVPAHFMPYSDPNHPQHPLYATLKNLLPPTSEARLAQATAACHATGINKPEDLSGIYSGGNGTILFTSNSLFAYTAELGLNQPVPTVQQTMRQVQQFDQRQQIQAQQTMPQQAQAPAMHR